MRRVLTAAFLCLCPAIAQAQGQVTLEGWFIAFEPCEAFQSKNKKTNPGDIVTEPMRAYGIIALNKAGGDFFQVRMPDAPVTAARWVHVSCGAHVVEAGTEVMPAGPGDAPVTPEPGAESADNLLALSWQPAFCETRPSKAECQALNDGQLPITETQLSIHGLWPQAGNFCGVPKALKDLDDARAWDRLPALDLDAETREALEVAMPGVASFLDRHEWIKHGTCHKGAGGADEYYDDTLRVLDAINGSAVGAFLAGHVGAEIETADLRELFDREFGDGAGGAVQVQCTGDGGRVLIQELRIALAGVIGEEGDIGQLMRDGDRQSLGCPRGIVDPAGLQ